MTLPPLSVIGNNGVADAVKITMTLRGVWDKILEAAMKHGLVPASRGGKVTATTMLSVAGAFVDWNLGRSDSAWAKVFKEVSSDSASELGARMLGKNAHLAAPAALSPLTILLGLDPAKRTVLLAAYEQGNADQQDRLRAHLVSLALPELALLADMSDQERTTLLGIVTPTPWNKRASDAAKDVKKEIEGGLDTVTSRLRRFTQSRQERQRKD